LIASATRISQRQEQCKGDECQQHVHQAVQHVRALAGLHPRRRTRVLMERALACTLQLSPDRNIQRPFDGRPARRWHSGQSMSHAPGPWWMGSAGACGHAAM